MFLKFVAAVAAPPAANQQGSASTNGHANGFASRGRGRGFFEPAPPSRRGVGAPRILQSNRGRGTFNNHFSAAARGDSSAYAEPRAPASQQANLHSLLTQRPAPQNNNYHNVPPPDNLNAPTSRGGRARGRGGPPARGAAVNILRGALPPQAPQTPVQVSPPIVASQPSIPTGPAADTRGRGGRGGSAHRGRGRARGGSAVIQPQAQSVN